PNRQIVIQSHRGMAAQRYHHFMLRDGDWKLLHASGFGNERFEGEPKFELYNLKDDPEERTNLVTKHPQKLAQLKKDYLVWFADVSNSRPNNYAPPRIVIGTEHENPTPLTQQDWLGTSWRTGATGHWIVDITKTVTANFDVIFHPDAITDDEAKVTLKIGDRHLERTTASNKLTFDNLTLTKGELRLEAIRHQPDKPIGAYQIIITTGTENPR
ncbi:MAG: hypothetical protein P8J87_21540, partial [Verrucomicrobiales bacterium]|nr:hypothetical protein [Verrucomicrobiales bacterium]